MRLFFLLCGSESRRGEEKAWKSSIQKLRIAYLFSPETKVLFGNLKPFTCLRSSHHICFLKLSTLYCLELSPSSHSSNGDRVPLSNLPTSSSLTMLSTLPICFMINNLPLLLGTCCLFSPKDKEVSSKKSSGGKATHPYALGEGRGQGVPRNKY